MAGRGRESEHATEAKKEAFVTLTKHTLLYSVIVLAVLLGIGWVPIVCVLSFRIAQVLYRQDQ